MPDTFASIPHLLAATRSSTSSVIMTDVSGIIRSVNPSFEAITGYAAADVLGQPLASLRSGKHSAAFYESIDRAMAAGKTWQGRWISRRKDGTCFEEEGVVGPAVDANGISVGTVIVMRDITAERELERELRQSQKLEAIGRLAKGVAHDFTNMLMVINGSAEALKMMFADRPDILPHLDRILEATGRSAALTAQLMAFARRQPLSLRTMNINRVIESLRDLIARSIRGNIVVTLDTCADAAYADIDPAQIEQIIMHLVVNAQDAMPKGGHLTIATRIITLLPEEAPQVRDVLSARDQVRGDYIRILVSDTGVGMEPDLQQRVFDPFFTTKGSESSTGLGLSTVYGIIKQHNGHVTLYSNTGVGTTFSVYIPLSPERNVCAKQIGPVPGGSETLLIIEDDAALIRLVSHALQEFGYVVLGASNAEEAVARVRNEKHPVSLALMDVFLPGARGPEVMQQIRQVSPTTRVVYTSGYPESHLKQKKILADADIVIPKPLLIRDLALLIRREIDKVQ